MSKTPADRYGFRLKASAITKILVDGLWHDTTEVSLADDFDLVDHPTPVREGAESCVWGNGVSLSTATLIFTDPHSDGRRCVSLSDVRMIEFSRTENA